MKQGMVVTLRDNGRVRVSPAARIMGELCDLETATSWEKINRWRWRAVQAMVGMGVEWMPFDFLFLAETCGGNYWFPSEEFYALAVVEQNGSACRAFEAAMDRPPYWFGPVDLGDGEGTRTAHRARDRLAVGSEFEWAGARVRVTSFAGDGQSLTATHSEHVDYHAKVRHRFRLTRDDLAAEWKRRNPKPVKGAAADATE